MIGNTKLPPRVGEYSVLSQIPERKAENGFLCPNANIALETMAAGQKPTIVHRRFSRNPRYKSSSLIGARKYRLIRNEFPLDPKSSDTRSGIECMLGSLPRKYAQQSPTATTQVYWSSVVRQPRLIFVCCPSADPHVVNQY